MCRRTTTDPLLAIVARSGYILLRNMRTGVGPLSAWVDFSGKGPFEPVGELSELIEDGLPVLTPTSADRLDIASKHTRALKADVGLTFLQPFFAVIGLAALTKLRARIQESHDAYVRIRLTDVKELSISLGTLSQDLDSSQLTAGSARLLADARRVAFASHVIQAQTVSIEAVTKSGAALDLGAGVVVAADVDAATTFNRTSNSELTFTGSAPITFAVRLYVLRLDAQRRVVRLDRAPGYPVLDRPGHPVKEAEPLLLNGPDGDLIADL
jgi:hypothetical protein